MYTNRNNSQKNPMLPPDKNLHAAVPPALLAQAEEAAQQEHISLDELVRDAMERRLRERRRQKLRAYGDAQARKIGVTTEEDVERVVHEFREEERQRGSKELGGMTDPANTHLPPAVAQRLLAAREAAFEAQRALLRARGDGEFSAAAVRKMMRLTRRMASIDAARHGDDFGALTSSEIAWLSAQGVPIERSQKRSGLDELLAYGKRHARERGLKPSDVAKAIAEVRRENKEG